MKKGTMLLLAAFSMALGVIIGLFCAPSVSNKGSRYFDSSDEETEDLYGC